MASWVDVPGRLGQAALRDLYARADVFVSPTDRASFGRSALEARAAGLPVVARRDSGVADVLADGVEALLVDGDEAAGLAVARLLCEPALHRALAGHNRAVPSAFTWVETTRLTRLAYALATGETAPAGPAGAARSYR